MGNFTAKRALYKPTVNEVGWGDLVNLNMDELDSFRCVKGADVISEAALFTTASFPTDGNYFDATGTSSITSMLPSGSIGTIIILHFDAALTITHHSTNLILPGGQDILTIAGDEIIFYEYASGNWRLIALSNPKTISGHMEVINGTVATSDDGTGYIQSGANGGANIAIDTNQIQARNNDATSALFINPLGDETVTICNTAGTVNVRGNITSNLGVDTVTDQGGGTRLKMKVVNIGDWDMNVSIGGTATINVAHGLTLANIRNVDVLIRNDDDDEYTPFMIPATGSATVAGGRVDNMDATNVKLDIFTGGLFDSVSFDDGSSYNRGWITIWYIA